MPEPSPAFVSTSTRCPALVSAFTPAGTSPTRYSLSFTSFGRPTIIDLLLSEVRSQESGVRSQNGIEWKNNSSRGACLLPLAAPKLRGIHLLLGKLVAQPVNL